MFDSLFRNVQRARAQHDVSGEKRPILEDVQLTGLGCRICLLADPTLNSDGKITDHKQGFVRVWTRKRWIVESRVRIVLRHATIRGQIDYCVQQNEAFSIGVNCGPSEYVRRQERISVDMPALLMLKAQTEPVPIRIFDVSPGGLGLLVPQPIIPDTCISVLLDNSHVFGLARYCHKEGNVFRVGFSIHKSIALKNQADHPDTLRVRNDPAAAFTLATTLDRLTQG